MTYAKPKLALCTVAAILLASATTAVLAGDGGDNLSPGEIFKNAQEKYASLTSYSDEGKTVAIVNGMTLTTTFTIRLARPNLYRIEWEQPVHSNYTNTGIVWSAGEGDFLMMGNGDAQKEGGQEMALASATGISGSAASTIPGTFFKMKWGDQLGGLMMSEKQQPDEKVGDMNCYVFTSELKGRTRTLWIGKADFLIHQVRNITSAEAMKATLEEAAKSHPEILARMQQSGIQDITSTETHTHIVLNPKLSAMDFAH
jgi:outer membrane lipoprotein-sorting protein